jgi:tyrosine-protein kinase Etk/Wzc
MRPENEYTIPRTLAPAPLIRDYPAVLLRGKWFIFIATALTVLAAFLFTRLREPTYQASAAVLIQTRLAETGGFFLAVGGSAIAQNIRQNELEILRSQSLAEAVARRLISQMYHDSAARQKIEIIKPNKKDIGKRTIATVAEVTERLMLDVDFMTVRESDVIKIITKSKSARESALLANLYVEEYYNRSLYKSREKSRALREFLQTQTSEQRTNLERVENALQGYMENKGIVSLDEESRRMIGQLSDLEAARNITDVSLQTLERTFASYAQEIPAQEQLLSSFIGGASDPYIRNLQEQLATLEVQRDVAVSKNPALEGKEIFGDRLKEIDAQIRAIQQKLQERTKEYIATLVPAAASPDQSQQSPSSYLRHVKQKMVELQVEIQASRAKKDALTRSINEYEREFERIPGRNIQYARLERGRLAAEKLFLVLNDKLNDATIAEQSQIGYIDIIDRATVPIEPSSPNLFLNLAIGLGLGLFLGVAFVVAREYRDVRIHTPEELRLKGYAASAVVTDMDDEVRRLGGNKVLSRYGRPVDPHLITLADSFSPVAEAYRKLRTNVQFDRSDRRPQTILVSSPNRGEGKSTTAANLAAAFAQSGKMTLLVDCNLRKPQIHRMFDLFQAPGLSELLTNKAGHESVVQVTTQRQLHVLCAGAIPHNPAELLSSTNMQDLLEQARLEYDAILLDTPPILAVADASVVSTFVDCQIVVIAAGQTRMEELERSIDILTGVSSVMPKFVLNKFDQLHAYGISYTRSGYGYYGSNDPDRPKRRLLLGR